MLDQPKDLEHMIDMFDRGLNSKDQRVLDAFKQLMVVVALTETEEKTPRGGPLRYLLEQMYDLERKVSQMESAIYRLEYELRGKNLNISGLGWTPTYNNNTSNYSIDEYYRNYFTGWDKK